MGSEQFEEIRRIVELIDAERDEIAQCRENESVDVGSSV